MSRNPYFEHDDRSENRRGMGRNRKYSPRSGVRVYLPMGGRSMRFQDHEGDIDMTAPGCSWNTERRFNPYKPQKHSGKRRKDKSRSRNKPFGKNEYESSEGNWFKVTIPYGRKLGKQFILKTLVSNCKVPFVPFNFQLDGQNAVFFVNDHSTATYIKDVNRRVCTPDGFKMGVFISRSSAPVSVMDDEAAQKIKECMSKNYDVSTHALNLRRFHHNQDLQSHGFYVPLYKPNIANTVVKIIKEHIPEIEILELGENRLHTLEAFSSLVPVCKQLTTLTLQNNRLKSVIELNHIKGMNIISLILDGNPLCDDYRDKTTYISAIRERLPKLMKLDGHELPAPIGFDLGSETVPTSKGSFFIAEDVKALVVQFLEQYYTIYDSNDRGKLLDAYHDQAVFSLYTLKTSQRPNQSSLQPYISDSRNLLKVTESAHRFKMLKQGRLAVVSILTQLPQTQHDPHSFAVDIFHVSPGLMTFCVTGVFKEVGHDVSNQPLRTFHRTFVATAQGQGFVIINEMLFVANATAEQIKSFKFPAPTPSPSPAPSIGDKSPSEKQQLAVEFTKLTGMNLDYSAKCLEENEWDYQKAFMVFSELNSLGTIPPEAFLLK